MPSVLFDSGSSRVGPVAPGSCSGSSSSAMRVGSNLRAAVTAARFAIRSRAIRCSRASVIAGSVSTSPADTRTSSWACPSRGSSTRRAPRRASRRRPPGPPRGVLRRVRDAPARALVEGARRRAPQGRDVRRSEGLRQADPSCARRRPPVLPEGVPTFDRPRADALIHRRTLRVDGCRATCRAWREPHARAPAHPGRRRRARRGPRPCRRGDRARVLKPIRSAAISPTGQVHERLPDVRAHDGRRPSSSTMRRTARRICRARRALAAARRPRRRGGDGSAPSTARSTPRSSRP